MDGYLGEQIVPASITPFASYRPKHWALYFIEKYGCIDGEHHKAWVLDQAARVLFGTPIIIRQATWSTGHSEYRVTTGDPSEKYQKWVAEVSGESDYDVGIAP